MDQEPDFVITLVHGTWARGAGWTKPGSRLRQRLDVSVAGSKEFNIFDWSGGNSANARIEAATRLSSDLSELIHKYPRSKHIVVGHSHGGNVALKAVELASLFDTVHIACLSTPFFDVKPRFTSLTEAQKTLVKYSLGWGSLLALSVLTAAFGVNLDKLGDSWIGYMTMGAGFLTIWFINRSWKDAADRFKRHVGIAIPGHARLLIIRAVGDEASALIALFQIATWIATKLGLLYLAVLSWPFEALEGVDFTLLKKHKVLFRLLLLSPLWLLVADFVGIVWLGRDLLSEVEKPIFAWFASTKLAPIYAWLASKEEIIGVLLAMPIILAALAILLGSSLPIGIGAFVGAVIYEVTVETVPVGSWTVHQVKPDASSKNLMHSASYENEEALSLLTAWISSESQVFAAP